jgi:hypothetical protein
MKDTPWDHGLSVAAEADGLVGHAGAVLLRKLADRAGLTAALGSALARGGKFPLVDRGVALVSMAVSIALGAASMNDITLLAHHAPVLGTAPSDTTVRRTLELADPATLDKIARVRARVRAHVWKLICATPAGFPWLQIAGKLLAGWLVIDIDATLITAHSDKEGAAPTFKKGYGLLTEPRDVTAAQEAQPSPRPIVGARERSRSPGRSSHVASLIATETGHTVLNHRPSFSSLPVFDVSRSGPRAPMQPP